MKQSKGRVLSEVFLILRKYVAVAFIKFKSSFEGRERNLASIRS